MHVRGGRPRAAHLGGAPPCPEPRSSAHPAYDEFGRVPARPAKGEPDHYHLDFGYVFSTAEAESGRIQESEVTGAVGYPLNLAERLVGPRIARTVTTSSGTSW